MDRRDLERLKPGLYRLYWKKEEGGGSSVAAVGLNSVGKIWFSPTNWIGVPSFDWEMVERAELLNPGPSKPADVSIDSLFFGRFKGDMRPDCLRVGGYVGLARFEYLLPTRGGTERDQAVSELLDTLLERIRVVAQERIMT